MKKIFLIISIVVLSQTTILQNIWSKNPPNVIIIHTDEHNFRTLGCYRNIMSPDQAFIWGTENIVETPNIDRIATEGIICTSFYANSPVCTPSRAALISGQYPQNTPSSQNDIKMYDKVESFASPLVDAGYSTGYAGKWHLDGHGKPQWAPERNFGFTDNKYMFNRGHWKKLDEDENGPYVAGTNNNGKINYDVDGADETTFTTDFLITRTINFIESNKDKPFLYMVSIPDPHGPNTVRVPYDTMYDHLNFSKPSTHNKECNNLPSWAKTKSSTISNGGLSNYFGMVKCIDDNVGRIFTSLEQNNLLDNTIIIFMSDHGDMLGEHKRDEKGVPFEASAKVPFIIRYPSSLKEGAIVNEAISNVDFKPTLMALLGITSPIITEGKDVSSLFIKNATPNVSNIAFIRGTGNTKKSTEHWVGAVTDRYKIVYSIDSEPWLFDLELDPNEITNYYNTASYEDIKKELATKLKEYGDTYGEPWLEDDKIKSEVEETILSTNINNKFDDNLLAYNIDDKIIIETKSTLPKDVNIFSINGYCAFKTTTSTSRIMTDSLNKGIYIVDVNYQGLRKRKKVAVM